jgi:predicted amidohydrolase
MQVFAVQFDIAWEDKNANYARVRSLIDEADPPPGSLLVLPEMFATGFSMHVDKIAEAADGPTQAFVSALAAERGCYAMAGIVTRHGDGRGSNDAVVVDPAGREIARYRKRHPFSPGGESKAYVAGNEIVVVPVGPFSLAPTICYDLRFPETYRKIVQRGAQLVLVIASWPVARVSHWRSLLVARAIENQCYVVGVNRIGRDPKLDHNGQSLIVDYTGRILADAADGERVIRADLELEPLLAYRRDLPFLADMRAEDRLAK